MNDHITGPLLWQAAKENSRCLTLSASRSLLACPNDTMDPRYICKVEAIIRVSWVEALEFHAARRTAGELLGHDLT